MSRHRGRHYTCRHHRGGRRTPPSAPLPSHSSLTSPLPPYRSRRCDFVAKVHFIKDYCKCKYCAFVTINSCLFLLFINLFCIRVCICNVFPLSKCLQNILYFVFWSLYLPCFNRNTFIVSFRPHVLTSFFVFSPFHI